MLPPSHKRLGPSLSLVKLKISKYIKLHICKANLDCISPMRVYVWLFFFLLWEKRISSLVVGPVHCSWDPKISFFSKTFIKNGFHGTIHTLKNYFATVFSVFSFQFQQNKFYPNTHYISCCAHTGHSIHNLFFELKFLALWLCNRHRPKTYYIHVVRYI